MRKVIVSTYVTLDGRVDEVRDWAVPYDDDGAAKYHTDLLMNSDGLLLGAGHFPFNDDPELFVEVLTGFIASTHPADLTAERIETLLRRGRHSKA